MTHRSCQRRLAALWLAGGLPILLLLSVQTLNGVFGSQTARPWSWFSTAVLPTLTVVLGTVAQQLHTSTKPRHADPFYYRLAFALSLSYLLLLLTTLVYVGVADVTARLTPLQVLDRSAVFLTPAHALVGLGLGAFFGSRN
jgi:hypothetical protein